MAKNLLIIALLCSASYLTLLTGVYDNWIQESLVDRFFTQGTTTAQAETTADTDWTAADTHPISIAVIGEDGRYGIQYSDETALIYQAFCGLLGEGLLSASNLQSISEEDWQWALQQKGVYVSYLSDIQLSTLSAWLNHNPEESTLTGIASQLILSQSNDDQVCLYYQNQADGNYYSLETAISYAGHMDSIVSNYKSNGATFAFEYEASAGYEGLDSYVMISPTLPTPTIYASDNPLDLEDTSLLNQLEAALEFHTQTSTQYNTPDGLVVREDEDVLRFSGDGTLSYQSEDMDYVRFPTANKDVTSYIEVCQTIVSQTIAPLAGEAQVILSDVQTTEEGYTIAFSYLLDGIEVKFSYGEEAALFLFQNGVLSDFTLFFRSYTATEALSMILPQTKAAAAMSALNTTNSSIALCYEDWGGDHVSVGWIAQAP